MKTRNSRGSMALTALLTAMTIGAAQADESSTDRFVMAVYEDMAQGRAILDGSPEGLIDALAGENGGKIASFEEDVNLCVAYTQVKQINEAAAHCDAAVSKASRELAHSRRTGPYYSAARDRAMTGQAIALSNRAVLHALSGEQDKAKELLESAIKLAPRKKFARSNLARVESDLAARL